MRRTDPSKARREKGREPRTIEKQHQQLGRQASAERKLSHDRVVTSGHPGVVRLVVPKDPVEDSVQGSGEVADCRRLGPE